METRIHIASEFSEFPGARYITDGDHSGEEFRTQFLVPMMADPKITSILVNLDGVEGYATSFLEEAFGGLARLFGPANVKQKLKFVSIEDPEVVTQITKYIDECEKGKKQ